MWKTYSWNDIYKQTSLIIIANLKKTSIKNIRWNKLTFILKLDELNKWLSFINILENYQKRLIKIGTYIIVSLTNVLMTLFKHTK